MIAVAATAKDQRVDLSWALVVGATAYEVSCQPTPPSGSPVSLGATATSQTFTGLTNGVTYTFTVKAKSATGAVVDSGSASATPIGSGGAQPAPLTVLLVPGDGQLSATWSAAVGALDYVVSVSPGNAPIKTTQTFGPVVFSGLANGTLHTVQVIGRSTTGTTVASGTATGTPTADPLGPPTFPVDLSGGVLDALTSLDADVTGLLTSAKAQATKWRYDFLRAQAVAAAQRAAVFEQQITDLMALDLAKLGTGELLLGEFVEVLYGALEKVHAEVQALGAKVTQLVPDLKAQAGALADAVNRLVLLQRLLTWLVQQSAVGFWVGLFGALIDDIAAFDTALPRVSDYLRLTFGSSDIGDTVLALLGDAQAKLMAQVDSLAAPVSASVGQMIEEAAAAIRRVFASFDAPLVVNTAPVPTQAPNHNIPGLGPLSAELNEAVAKVVAEVRARVNEAVAGAGGTGAAGELFVVVVVTYLVLPILAALVIAIAGGPVSAALLAAAVTLAAQELVHLVARLLSGPLLSQLDAAQAAVDRATAALQQTVAKAFEGQLGDMTGPAAKAEFLAAQLASLREELPTEYLHETARLLGDARDATLRTAAGLALAAEQAVGMETGTVYDVVRADYGGAPATSARAPGGRDPNRFAAAALLRDLDRLDQARLQLADGKQLRVTQRLSLADLLGGAGPAQQAAFQRLLAGEEVAVRLTEELLLDRAHPGLYCALLDDVRVTAVLPGGALPLARSLPVHVTHLGESRTRVRVDSNPAVAGVQPAPRFRLTSRRFALELLTEQVVRTVVALWVIEQWLRSLEIYWVRKPDISVPDYQRPIRDRARQIEPAMADADELSLVVPAIVALLETSAKNQNSTAPGWVLLHQADALGDGARLEYLRTGRLPDGTVAGRGVAEVAARAHRIARARRAVREGKWAGTHLEEDRDPTVGGLGFATLVRDLPPETSVFDLVATGPLTDVAAPLPGPDTPLPLSSAQAAQYRPFENRGLEGSVLLRLPTAGQSGVPQPTDLLLEVTYRAYHSTDLEAAVRASRERRSDELEVAGTTVGGGATLVAAPQLLRRRGTGRRTIHLSLRGHRDRTLALWQPALAAYRSVNGDTPADGANWDALAATAPLRPADPFQPLPLVPATTSFSVSFGTDAVTGGPPVGPDGAALAALAQRVVITPDMLGLPTAALALPVQPGVGLAGISIAVVPTAAGARRRGRHPKQKQKLGQRWHDPLTPLTLRVDGPVAPLLPGFATAKALGARLVVSPYEPGDEPAVALEALFATAGAPSLTFQLGSTADDKLLYDVIIGLTFTAPVDEVTLRP